MSDEEFDFDDAADLGGSDDDMAGVRAVEVRHPLFVSDRTPAPTR
jgi:hypothetical protein